MSTQNTEQASLKNQTQHWDKIIRSKKKVFDLRLKEVWDYRYLIKMFMKRDFVIFYKQTILGPIWYLFQPVISSIMYAFIFGALAGVGTDGVPFMLFYFSGTMIWSYFSSCLEGCANTFISNQNMFGKVYFPRLTAPIATCGINMLKLLIQFSLLLVLLVYYIFVKKVQINISLLALSFPLIFLWVGLMGGALGLIISSLTTKYRDLNMLLGFGLQLAMYVTPVVYPLSQLNSIPFSIVNILPFVNPMCAPVEFFRIAFYGAGHLTLPMFLTSLGFTFILVFFGLVLFTKNERNFVDVI